MTKPHVVESESDSDSDSSSGAETSPIKSTTKKTQLPAVDFAASTPKPTRTAKASQKQKENQQRAEAKKDAQLEALKKQIKSLKKKNDKINADLQERDANHMPAESEEENDDVDMSSFSASFVSKGVVNRKDPQTAPKKLRKSGETPIYTPMSRVPLSTLQDDSNITTSDHEMHDMDTADTGENGTTPLSKPSQKRPRSRSPAAKKSRKRTKVVEPLPKAEFVGGKPPGGSRTNLKDYTEPAAKLLKRAMHKYELRVWTQGGYPLLELQGQWVKEIWDEVCQEADERMELTERMGSMIQKYGPHGRSSMKDGIRPLVAPTYKFKIGESDKIIRKNIKIYKMLLDESGFHYENTKERTGYAKNPIIMEAIRCIWFKTKAGRGVMFPEYFSPITLVTLALIFTAIEFCIEEYSTGRFKQGIFDELLNKDRYETHLKDLTDWAALKPSASTAFLQRIHDQCRASTGAALVKQTGRMTEAARERALAELEAMELDGGDQDPDDDEDDD